MWNMDKSVVIFYYTDGSCRAEPFDMEKQNVIVCDGLISAEIITTQTEEKIYEYDISLKALKEKPLKFITLKFEISKELSGDNLFVFTNGTTSNDAAEIVRFSETLNTVTHDLCLMKNTRSDRVLDFALLSADRFYSYFEIIGKENCVKLFYSMEDKPLEPGKEYVLEKFMISESLENGEFLKLYTDKMSQRYPRPDKKHIPTGYCSWSHCYHNVDEDKVLKSGNELIHYFADKEPSLVQIDDGWQTDTSFPGQWATDKSKFSRGLLSLSRHFSNYGMSLGLWFAPFLVGKNTAYYQGHPNNLQKDVDGNLNPSLMVGPNPVYPLKIDDGKILDAISDNFRRAVEKYKVSYFKIDFLMCSLTRSSNSENMNFVKYDADYSVAVYRNALRKIRETVGKDCFLLACGAPIPESAGIFDGTRVTPDIVWGKNKHHPSCWDIIKFCSRSIMLRYFYHEEMFIIDPDGLVVRDFDIGDGYNTTYQEARLWATEIAMSGGSILINEDIGQLGESRRSLFEQMLPVYGRAARPLDFFEMPQPSVTYLDIDENTKIVAAFNWEDKIIDKTLDLNALGFDGKTVAVKCWEKEIVGVIQDHLDIKDMMPHSAMVYLIKKVPDVPSFLFGNSSLFVGVDIYSGNYIKDRLVVLANEKLKMCKNKNIFIFVPEGYTFGNLEVVKSGDTWKVIQTFASDRTEIIFN